MRNALRALGTVTLMSACVSNETMVHSYNGHSVEVQLIGDTFAFGTTEQQQAQIDAAQVKATAACGKPATYLSRRMDQQPQNGLVMVPAKHVAIFRCG